MTSIDDLFRGRAVPTANPTSNPNKRKLDPSSRDPSEIYKATKVNGKSPRAPSATVADDDDEDVEAGPSLPPQDDGQEEEENPDDEEGRFFGGGVGADTRDALDYLDGEEEGPSGPEKLDAAWLRRTVQTFSSRIAKNAEQRAKFEDQPQHFMASEAALDEDIKALSLLSEAPSLYGLFAELGGVEKLAGLLAHENTDIAIGAVQVLAELTDEDVATEQEQWDSFVAAGFDADLPGLLVGNLQRLNEDGDDAEGDRSGVYHSLSLIENLASQITAAEAMFQESGFFPWLIQRIQKSESPSSSPITQNKQYSAEILAILLQSSSSNRQFALKASTHKPKQDTETLDIVDILLQLLAPYRKRDPPKDSHEEEFAENIFDALIVLADTIPGKTAFVRHEGIELALIMLRESTSAHKPKFSKPRALRLLDHAAAIGTGADNADGGEAALAVCERIVEAAGLKPLFAAFMKSSRDDGATGTGHASERAEKRQDTEHILGIFASMLRLLPGDSAPRIRLLSKFLEGKEYEKLARLLKLRREYKARLAPVDERIAVEREAFEKAGDGSAEEREQLEDEWLGRRLDAGLFSFQTVDVVLAWLAAEDDGAAKKIGTLLEESGLSMGDVARTLREQLAGLEAQRAGGEDDGLEAIDASIDMMKTLLGCID